MIRDFHKVIMPGQLPHYSKKSKVPIHVGITFKGGKLSMSGVVGAYTNGNCAGSCGQCLDTLKDSKLTLGGGWTGKDVARLYDVWDRWHLNDMRAECEHQIALGWREEASRKVTLYYWTVKHEWWLSIRETEKSAKEAIRAGHAFMPTPDQTFLANLDHRVITHTDSLPTEISEYYEPKKPLYAGDIGHTEIKALGWLTEKEHPDGLLSRPCPVCGYKRGHSWCKEEVPEDVLVWLQSLPEASHPCAWKLT